jgi:hypothetical protein
MLLIKIIAGFAVTGPKLNAASGKRFGINNWLWADGMYRVRCVQNVALLPKIYEGR